MIDDDDDFDAMVAGTVNWPDWTINLTFDDIEEASVGLDTGYIAAVRYNVSFCDGHEDGDDGDADHCTWLAYGRTSSEAYLTADTEVWYWGEDYDPETMTWCYDTEGDTDSNDDECGTSVVAGPSVD
ncbi:TPA: hypothetical protein DEP34_00060 [Candidatus Uhrbacteria bacterium]|nr:hypothetical protein [Candidatus Uhrbacteria bacterium]